MWIERRCGAAGLVSEDVECRNIFGISDQVVSQGFVSRRCEYDVLQIRTIACRSVAGNDRIRDGVGSRMARHTVTEAVRRHVLRYGAVNQRCADARENATAHAGSVSGTVTAYGGVSKRHSGIVTDSASGAVRTRSAIAGRVATDETARHIQRPIVEDAATAAAGADTATWISVAGVIIADGRIRQSHCSLIYVYAATAAAVAGIMSVASTVVLDGDPVKAHGSGLTRKKITSGPYPATVTTVATAWSTAISGAISSNRDAREC